MDGRIIIGTELDTKQFDKEIAILEDKLHDIEATLEMADKDKTLFSTSEVKEMEAETEKLKNQIIGLRKQQEKTMVSSNLGIGKIIKKITRWGLAIFGIRSAYMGIRQAMSTITAQDAQLKADIDYMKNAIAYALEPVIRTIVDLMKKLMYYVGYIIYKWTGKNIFENANKSLQNANKEASKLQKTLASFDEINVLNANNGTGTDNITPSFDLTNYTNIPIPGWVEWIASHKDVFVTVAEGFGILFGAKTIASILSATKKIMGTAGVGTTAGTGLLGIYALLLLIGGFTFYKLYENLKELGKKVNDLKKDLDEANKNEVKVKVKTDDYWDNFWEKYFSKDGIKESDIKNAMGMAQQQITADTEQIFDEIDDKLKYHFGDLTASLFGLSTHTEWQELLINKAKQIFSNFEQIKKGYNLGLVDENVYKEAVENTDKTIKYVEQKLGGPLKGTTMAQKYFGMSDKDFENLQNTINSELTKIKLKDLKVDITADTSKMIKYFEDLKSKNNLFSKIVPIDEIISALKNTKKNALGGIINMPGRGVSLGYSGGYNQIGGEAGREGLIPMDNASQMALIGQELAKYVNINLTNITKLDSHVIAREQRKVNAESDFAFNR